MELVQQNVSLLEFQQLRNSLNQLIQNTQVPLFDIVAEFFDKTSEDFHNDPDKLDITINQVRKILTEQLLHQEQIINCLIELSSQLLQKGEDSITTIDQLKHQNEEIWINSQTELQLEKQTTLQWQIHCQEEITKNSNLVEYLAQTETNLSSTLCENQLLERYSEHLENFNVQKQDDGQNTLNDQNSQQLLFLKEQLVSSKELIKQQKNEIISLKDDVVFLQNLLASYERDQLRKDNLISNLKKHRSDLSETQIKNLTQSVNRVAKHNPIQPFRSFIFPEEEYLKTDAQQSEEDNKTIQGKVETLFDVCQYSFDQFINPLNTNPPSRYASPTRRRGSFINAIKPNLQSLKRFEVYSASKRQKTDSLQSKKYELIIADSPERVKLIQHESSDETFMIHSTPYDHFFTLTVQSVKLNSKHFDKIINKNPYHLYKKMIDEEIPFNEWYQYIRSYLESGL